MKYLSILSLLFVLSSCSAVVGIFKAGWWVGVVMAVIVIIFIWIIFGGRKK